MTRKEVIKNAYEYLKTKGIVHTQKDVAQKMGASPSNISSAMSGVEAVLTDKFLGRFNAAFGNVFNDEWLLTGQGKMLRPVTQSVGNITESSVAGVNVHGNGITINPNAYDALLKIVEANQNSTKKFQEQIDRLISIIEIKYGTENR